MTLSDNVVHGAGSYSNPTIIPASGTTTFSGTGTLAIANGTIVADSVGSADTVTMAMGVGGLIWVQPGGALWNGDYSNTNWTNNYASMRVDGTFELWGNSPVNVDALTGSGVIKNTEGARKRLP